MFAKSITTFGVTPVIYALRLPPPQMNTISHLQLILTARSLASVFAVRTCYTKYLNIHCLWLSAHLEFSIHILMSRALSTATQRHHRVSAFRVNLERRLCVHRSTHPRHICFRVPRSQLFRLLCSNHPVRPLLSLRNFLSFNPVQK